jgi:hypothetical protein
VVLTTGNHANDCVFNLTLTGADGTSHVLGVTGFNNIYSQSRDWVSASELKISKNGISASGNAQIAA